MLPSESKSSNFNSIPSRKKSEPNTLNAYLPCVIVSGTSCTLNYSLFVSSIKTLTWSKFCSVNRLGKNPIDDKILIYQV